MGDFNSGLLNKFSRVREYHTQKYFAKHGHLLKWKSNESILDIGCGTGDLSYNYIYPLIPEDFQQFVCTDISKDMLKIAEKQFEGEPKVHCDVLDITCDVQSELRGKFDHIFSLYCLMWVADQRKAFENIYNLLSPGGGCFLVFVDRHAFMDTIFQLVEKPRWKKFVPDLEVVYPFPYGKEADPVKIITDMMKSIGYVNFEVYREKSDFVFHSKEEFLGFFKAIPNPLSQMSPEEQEDYLKDAVEIAYSNNIIRDCEEEDNGALLVVYGEK